MRFLGSSTTAATTRAAHGHNQVTMCQETELPCCALMRRQHVRTLQTHTCSWAGRRRSTARKHQSVQVLTAHGPVLVHVTPHDGSGQALDITGVHMQLVGVVEGDSQAKEGMGPVGAWEVAAGTISVSNVSGALKLASRDTTSAGSACTSCRAATVAASLLVFQLVCG